MEQESASIFDESFEEEAKPRRVSLLNWWHKGYLIFMCLASLYVLVQEINTLNGYTNGFNVYILPGMISVLSLLWMLASALMVMLELKYAILMVVLAVIIRCGVFAAAVFLLGVGAPASVAVTIVFHLPFLAAFLKLRKKWENEAVKI